MVQDAYHDGSVSNDEYRLSWLVYDDFVSPHSNCRCNSLESFKNVIEVFTMCIAKGDPVLSRMSIVFLSFELIEGKSFALFTLYFKLNVFNM